MKESIKRQITCTVCPLGCKLSVEKAGEQYLVFGNLCKRGVSYAIEEMTHPMRMLTSSVEIENAAQRRLPVHSSAPLAKELLLPAMQLIKQCRVTAPIEYGQVIIANILNSAVDICASRDMELQ